MIYLSIYSSWLHYFAGHQQFDTFAEILNLFIEDSLLSGRCVDNNGNYYPYTTDLAEMLYEKAEDICYDISCGRYKEAKEIYQLFRKTNDAFVFSALMCKYLNFTPLQQAEIKNYEIHSDIVPFNRLLYFINNPLKDKLPTDNQTPIYYSGTYYIIKAGMKLKAKRLSETDIQICGTKEIMSLTL